MSGLFGGLLGLIELIGTVVCAALLYVLIGAKGTTQTTRKGRLIVGGAVVGLLVGAIPFQLLPAFEPPFEGARARTLVAFGGSVVIVEVITFFLEVIRKDIEGHGD